ncbi:hypothetical protein BH09MYX1_BH09MYX1_67930 [soil metagenome]
MSPSRRLVLSRKEALIAATFAVSALSTQLLACDPLPPPHTQEPAASVSASASEPVAPPAPDAGH